MAAGQLFIQIGTIRPMSASACLQGDARLQARDPLEAEARQHQRAAVEPQRDDQVGVRVEDAEARRHHAHDFPGLALDDDATPDDGRIAAEAALPVAVREHHSGWPAGLLIGVRQPSADGRRDAERLERAVRHVHATHLFRLACPGHRRRRRVPDADVLERAILFGEGEEHRRRQPEIAGHVRDPRRARREQPQRDEPLRFGIRQRTQQHAVDDAEDRGGRADADRQRQHGDRREHALPVEHAQPVSQVAQEIVEPGHAALVAQGVHRVGEARRRKHRWFTLGAGVAAASTGLRGHLGVEPQFLLQVGVASPRPDRRHQTRDPFAKRGQQHACFRRALVSIR